MQSWLVLLPPLLVLTLAIITHNVLRSLLIGIIAASFIAANFSPVEALKIAFNKLLEQTGLYDLFTWSGDFNKIYIYGFLLLLGIIIALITYTGGTIAYSKKMSGRLSGKKAAEQMSVMLSSCFFLDDYFNSLTTGSVVKPIFDYFNIARVKLAFLLNAMSSSMAVLIPISSWTAMIVSQLLESGIAEEAVPDTLIIGDPFVVYLRSIPYCLYPICMIIVTWFIVERRISYGTMAKHEALAATTGNTFGGKNPPAQKLKEPEHTQGTLSDFLIPMGTLIGLIITGLLYTGGFSFFGGTKNFIDAIRSSNNFVTFFYAGLATLIICSVYFLVRKKISFQKLLEVYTSGFELMKNSILLLLFAATLGSLLKDDLQTGQYLAQFLVGSVPTFLLPIIFFITSTAVAVSIGSSWGTILMMLPIALPMVASVSGTGLLTAQDVVLLLPSIGAILSGSVSGTHISPISDATVISSTAAGAHHLDHVTTQLNYVIPVVIGTVIAYVLSGLFAGKAPLLSLGIPFAVALGVSLAIITLLNLVHKKRVHR